MGKHCNTCARLMSFFAFSHVTVVVHSNFTQRTFIIFHWINCFALCCYHCTLANCFLSAGCCRWWSLGWRPFTKPYGVQQIALTGVSNAIYQQQQGGGYLWPSALMFICPLFFVGRLPRHSLCRAPQFHAALNDKFLSWFSHFVRLSFAFCLSPV